MSTREGENMGLSIGKNVSITKITLKKADGAACGTVTKTKPSKVKKKKLRYNLKEISSQLMQARTAGSAKQIAVKARTKAATLRKKLKTGEYDDKELEAAIIHAEQMERVARKRVKHLQEEESVKTSGGVCAAELEEEVDINWEIAEGYDSADLEMEKMTQEMLREMQELMQEFQETMQDTMEQLEESAVDELAEEVLISVSKEMDPADLELLKKKHRADELREIAEADMKYLRAIFDKLEKEKRDAACGVSLELGGSEMPVMTEAPVVMEGAVIDVTV